MAQLVIRVDLATESLLDVEDNPDRHKVAQALKALAQRIDQSGGNIYQLNGEVFGSGPHNMDLAGTLTIEY